MVARVYLDYNASAPVRPEAAAAVADALAYAGNPSSIHAFGRAAHRLLEDSRERIAGLTGARPAAVIFTSGATEANALALGGLARRATLVSAIEHPSIAEARHDGTIAVDRDGLVDLAALDDLLGAAPAPALVAVMLANNETGVVQPIEAVVRIARAHGALVHCDAVQAAGKLPLDIAALGVDSLSLSAHKLGGPQGCGALVLADADTPLTPLLAGGGQERRRRPGTENLPGIAGFAAAAALAGAELNGTDRLRGLRDRLEREVRQCSPAVVILGAAAPRLANTSCLAVPGVPAQTLLMALDLAGVAVSAGSACSSGRLAPSPVVKAMGFDALAGSAIRVSFGWASAESDVDQFLTAFAGWARLAA
jgi:cysteine desulfurase